MSESAATPGALYVISAPSGAGKTSLVRALLEQQPNARMSVSHTTRAKREHETDGVDYFFVDRDAFERMRAAGGFLEHAEVFGNLYGTGRAQVDALIRRGHAVILEIDWQGARQVRRGMPDCRSIFVLPPSRDELERRLRGRSTDREDVIRRRLAQSVADMQHWNEFDFVLVNDDFDTAVRELGEILAGGGEHLARDAERPELAALLADLLS